jgi:hypothetical protein
MGMKNEMFVYNFEQSCDELFAVLKDAKNDLNNSDLKKDLNFRLSNFLHSLIDYWERIENDVEIDSEERRQLSAFRYAQNELKHGIEVVSLYERSGGFSFPIHFPMSIPDIIYRWASLKVSNPKFEKQHKNYEDLLQGENLISSVETVKKMIAKHIALQ